MSASGKHGLSRPRLLTVFTRIMLVVAAIVLAMIIWLTFLAYAESRSEISDLEKYRDKLSVLTERCAYSLVTSGYKRTSVESEAILFHYADESDFDKYFEQKIFGSPEKPAERVLERYSGDVGRWRSDEEFFDGIAFRSYGGDRREAALSSREHDLGFLAIAPWFYAPSNDKAINMLVVCQAAADHGDGRAALALSNFYEGGSEEVLYLIKAAELDDIPALVRLADKYAAGEGVSRDRALAMRYYLRAALLGDVYAQWKAGLILQPVEPESSFKLLTVSASLGSCSAALALGDAYAEARDYKSAYFWSLVANWLSQEVGPAYPYSYSEELDGALSCDDTHGQEWVQIRVPADEQLAVESAVTSWRSAFLERKGSGAEAIFSPSVVSEPSVRSVLGDWKALPDSVCSTSLRNDPMVAVELFRKVSSYIWRVEAYSGGEAISQGSAVAFSPKHLLTNCHVVEGSEKVLVKLAGATQTATVYGADVTADKCVLEVEHDIPNYANGYRPPSSVSVGENVYAIGNPRGLDNSLSSGLISGVRDRDGITYFQTTAAISPGSSGGALVDESGSLLAITSFRLKDSEGLNFAISASEFCKP